MMLVALFFLLQVLDGVTTVVALRSGKARESNRLMAWLFERMGIVPALIFTKGGVTALVAWGLHQYPLWLGALCLLYLVVVINNFLAIDKA